MSGYVVNKNGHIHDYRGFNRCVQEETLRYSHVNMDTDGKIELFFSDDKTFLEDDDIRIRIDHAVNDAVIRMRLSNEYRSSIRDIRAI